MGVEEFKKDDLTDLAIECRSSSKSTMLQNKLVCKENSLIVNEDFDVYEDGFVVSEKFNTRLEQTEYQKVEVVMNGLEHKLLGFYLKLDIRDNKVKLKCGNKLIPIKVNKRVKKRLKNHYRLMLSNVCFGNFTQALLSNKHFEEELSNELFPVIQ